MTLVDIISRTHAHILARTLTHTHARTPPHTHPEYLCTCRYQVYSVVVVYPPPPVACRWFDCPMVCSTAMLSLYFASSSATATGFIHKSQGDNTVCMCVQLKRSCVVHVCTSMSVLQRSRVVMGDCER